MTELFDYVVVGGGSAGSILASRLSDTRASVCLLESGPMDSNFWIHVPGGAQNVHNNPAITWSYEAQGPQGTGRRIAARHGRVIGGSGSINGMMINRGAAADFDRWTQFGNRGWRYEDVLPYFMRTERRIGHGDDRHRGRSGAMPVVDNAWQPPLSGAFMQSAESLGIPRDSDHNGPRPDGVCIMQFNMLNGRRVSAARAFLHPAMRRNRNLQVRTGAHAVRLLFDGRRASGVRYAPDGDKGVAIDVGARREVILTAGAVATPKLLQLSGVGPAALLNDIGVPVLHALDGVGKNLQDHYHVRYVARIKNALTINNLVTGPRLVGEVLKWLARRPGVVGNSPYTAVGTCRSDPSLPVPDVTLIFTPGSFSAATRSVTPVAGASCIVWQMRPSSLGYLRARSADPFAPPEINPNYLAAQEDRDALVGGIKLARRIFNAPPFAEYFLDEEAPGAAAASDQSLLEFALQTGMTAFHFTGTCRMAPSSDPTAVVDDQLRVHGIDGLRVADASIMPALTSGNTNAPTMMIAEKASDLILRQP